MRSGANLGVLGARTVNVIVHGHEPALSEMLAAASSDPEILEYARNAGAEGVTLAGICCTANEILIRHGIAVAGNFLQQELAIITGAVEMMITDVQCCMASLPKVASHYHTKVVSTSDIARTIGADHDAFDEEHAYDNAKNLLKRAIDNYKNRDPRKVAIPDACSPLVAGFSVPAIKYMLGGSFRASFRPLNDAIIAGRIKGLVGIVGCNNPKSKLDNYINTLTAELLRRDVLVLKTGCAAIASGKEGMLTPEAALEQAGPGLREVCEAVGMPAGAAHGKLRGQRPHPRGGHRGGAGRRPGRRPVGRAGRRRGAGVDEREGRGHRLLLRRLGRGCHSRPSVPHFGGSDNVTRFLNEETQTLFGASFHVCPDPGLAPAKIMELLNRKREKLGINKKLHAKAMDMKDRRA